MAAIIPAGLRAVTWNIERGYRMQSIIDELKREDPDVIMLQEVDVGCDRSYLNDTGAELAAALNMQVVFVTEKEYVNGAMGGFYADSTPTATGSEKIPESKGVGQSGGGRNGEIGKVDVEGEGGGDRDGGRDGDEDGDGDEGGGIWISDEPSGWTNVSTELDPLDPSSSGAAVESTAKVEGTATSSTSLAPTPPSSSPSPSQSPLPSPSVPADPSPGISLNPAITSIRTSTSVSTSGAGTTDPAGAGSPAAQPSPSPSSSTNRAPPTTPTTTPTTPAAELQHNRAPPTTPTTTPTTPAAASYKDTPDLNRGGVEGIAILTPHVVLSYETIELPPCSTPPTRHKARTALR